MGYEEHSNQTAHSQESTKDFFVSYSDVDQSWAEWIAWQLEAKGYTTVVQAWDFLPGSNFVLEMNKATITTTRTIVVLSPDYLNALSTQSQWAVAFMKNPTGDERALIPVRIRECTLTGILASIVLIDLVRMEEPEAREKLLRGVSYGRGKPLSSPAFPAIMDRSAEAPFPGAQSSTGNAGDVSVQTAPSNNEQYSQSQQQTAITPSIPSRKFPLPISRRAIIVGLPGLIIVGSGAIVWLAIHQGSSHLGTTITTYRKHSDFVSGVVWSHDGISIASASIDKTVQVWNASTGNQVFAYTRHAGPVNAVAWSGKRIASANDNVQVWDSATGNNSFTYHGHSSEVYTVAWSPDGTRIVSGSYDRTVQVWDATNGTRLIDYTGHAQYVLAVAWSPDKTRIASGGHDRTVQVWDAASGVHILTYYGHTNGVSAIAWSPDSKYIASGGYDKTVHVWDATSHASPFIYRAHTSEVYAVAWSPDGTRIASGGHDRTVQVWDALTGDHAYAYREHSGQVNTVAWSPDGTRIVSGSTDKTVRVWRGK